MLYIESSACRSRLLIKTVLESIFFLDSSYVILQQVEVGRRAPSVLLPQFHLLHRGITRHTRQTPLSRMTYCLWCIMHPGVRQPASELWLPCARRILAKWVSAMVWVVEIFNSSMWCIAVRLQLSVHQLLRHHLWLPRHLCPWLRKHLCLWLLRLLRLQLLPSPYHRARGLRLVMGIATFWSSPKIPLRVIALSRTDPLLVTTETMNKSLWRWLQGMFCR